LDKKFKIGQIEVKNKVNNKKWLLFSTGGKWLLKDGGASSNTRSNLAPSILPKRYIIIMAIRVVEFSCRGYKIRKIFA
jgi:hypothetical protein